MKIKAFVLSLLMGAAAGFAQDEPITKIETMDLYNMNSAKYAGIKFIYNNIITYNPTNPIMMPPFPYKDGRVRDGKFKASQTAMDNYLKEIGTKYNGKIFTLVNFVPGTNNIPALVVACENGDTLYYSAISSVGAEFTSKTFLDAEKKKIGTKFLYQNEMYSFKQIKQIVGMQPTQVRSYAFKNAKTGKDVFFIPTLTEWKITDVSFDSEYFGEHTVMNDALNGTISRIKYTIENPNYGKYYAFLQENQLKSHIIAEIKDEYFSTTLFIHDITEFSDEDLKQISAWAAKGYPEAVYVNEKIEKLKKGINPVAEETRDISDKVKECAKKGYPYAVYEAIQAENVTFDEKIQFIKTTMKKYGDKKCFKDWFNTIALKLLSEERGDMIDETIKKYELLLKNGITSFEYYNDKYTVQERIELLKGLKASAAKQKQEEEEAIKVQQERQAKVEAIQAKQREAEQKAIIQQRESLKQELEKLKKGVKKQTTEKLKKALSLYEERLEQFKQLNDGPQKDFSIEMMQGYIKIIKDELKTRKD